MIHIESTCVVGVFCFCLFGVFLGGGVDVRKANISIEHVNSQQSGVMLTGQLRNRKLLF